jgi:hypothetical protein
MLGVGIASPAVTTFGLGQGPWSRKVPFAFAVSMAVVESHTTIVAHAIEGLLIGKSPTGSQPNPTGIYVRLLTQT